MHYLFFFFFAVVSTLWSEQVTLHEIVDKEFSKKKPFTKSQFDKNWKRIKKKENFIKYQIINGNPYGPDNNIYKFLQVLCKKYTIPDLEFVYCFQDCVSAEDAKKYSRAPIFASARNRSDENIILFVDWYYHIDDNSSLLGWNSLFTNIAQISQKITWEDKIPTLVWRGATNDGYYSPENWTLIPRGYLVNLSKETSLDYINAGFTNYPSWTVSNQHFFSNYVGKSEFLSPYDQIRHKYQIDIDGVTATFTALPWKLLSGSLVFKQESDNIMWFHHALIPGTHYIEVRRNLSNLQALLDWAKNNDAKANEIGANGRKFVLDYLNQDTILEYCYLTLLRYAKLQNFPER